MTDSSRCQVTLAPCPNLSQLEPLWRDIESRANCSVFVSWAWIGTLLSAFTPRARLVRVERDGRLVALGILAETNTSRGLFRRGPTLHLNETGDPSADGVMIEYNGLLAEPQSEAEAMASVIAHLARAPSWHGLRLSGVPADWQAICAEQGLAWHLLAHPQTAPVADLQCMDPDDPVRSLSRNTREQIRRSVRLFEQDGPLALARASTLDQALEWFSEMERLHTASWAQRGKSGAFRHAHFAEFHRHLIGRNFALGVPDLLRLTTGDVVLGYLYNFRWKNNVYAYQSGFRYDSNPRWRPGLVGHVLAMRLYRGEGISLYRFLAGEARYKNSLSTRRDELYWLLAYRRTPFRSIERTARSVRHAIQGRLKP